MARTKLQFYFLTTGVVSSAIFVGLVYRAVSKDEENLYHDIEHVESRGFLVNAFWTVVSAIPFIVTFFLAAMCFHIAHVRSCKYHTLTSLLIMYLLNQLMRFFSVIVRYKFDQRAKNPRLAQETFLKKRMKRDGDTIYGKRYNFRNINNLEDLRQVHPLTTYEHYAEYVQRMADGEDNVLICEKLQRFGITSGTTGKGKLIPLPQSRFWESGPSLSVLWGSVAAEKFGRWSPLQKDLVCYVNPKPTKTSAGHTVGPMHLFTEDQKVAIQSIVSTPWAVNSISSEFEATYLVLLFGLRDQNIGRWMGPFSSMIHKAVCLIENNWKRFVHDIRTGTVDQGLKIPSEVREACEKELIPDPERAEELRQEFEKGFDGIIRRVWPYMTFIWGVNTADFTEKLENRYARGVPIFSPAYASTEGDYGLNLLPGKDDKYVLLPHCVIFEFIPENDINKDKPVTLLIDEVQKGHTYELVVSTLSGFYRYRFGDVVKVIDFYYKTPVVKFMYRSGQLLNLRAEKVTELSVDEAVNHVAVNLLGAKLVCWTSAESALLTKINDDGEFDQSTQFYLIFVELEGNNDSKALDNKHQQQFDDALEERNNYYKGYRNAGTISPPRLYLVKPGTFNTLQDYIVANSTASYNQYKVPRKLKTAGTLKLMLDARVV